MSLKIQNARFDDCQLRCSSILLEQRPLSFSERVPTSKHISSNLFQHLS
jgi:hypothetical protein